MYLYALIPVAVVIFLFWWFWRKPSARRAQSDLGPILSEHVKYYRLLPPDEQRRFAGEVAAFMQHVTVEGVGTEVEQLDRVLIAASAVIPIFAFPGWKYNNLTNVILYPDTFDEKYQYEGSRRNILGMVGSGPLNGQMLLSRSALRNGFSAENDGANTAIHEFVHLVDKTDGTVDGMPQTLLHHQYSVPWLKVMHAEIKRIETGHSDINPYAAMNESEFLAVTAEYFFERPERMQEHHPELYAMLSRMFQQDPAGQQVTAS
ncbi:M90 family metallopeptidase [Chitinophaga lutea]